MFLNPLTNKWIEWTEKFRDELKKHYEVPANPKPTKKNSIPATEEELKKIEGCTIWVKRKDDHSKIGWRRITGPVDIKTFYIFNPNTKCWEDREENADKEERLRHHYNGGQP